MDKKIVRRYQLSVENIETIEDVKKILNAMQIRIDTDNPLYTELSNYFTVEVVPRGYVKFLEKVGYEKMREMTYEEISKMSSELLDQTEK